VVGLGTMGAGIAEVFARSGFDVVGIETDAAAVDRGRAHLERSTGRAVARGKLRPDGQRQLLDSVTLSTEFSRVKDCQLVVEAVFEDADLKASVFRRLGEEAPEDALLVTNTSSLSITAIAAATTRPGRVVGVHFFNPAPVQRLVEVISTVLTDETTVQRLEPVLRSLGKTPIQCGDRAGFVVNSLLIGYLNRAVMLYSDGVASREEIDRAMVERAGYPQGPLALLDLIGLDVALAVLVRMYDETRDRRLAPASLLRQLVSAGLLGRKSGRGFYTYEDGEPTDAPGPVRTRARTLGSSPLSDGERSAQLAQELVVPYLNDALTMVQTGFATPSDVDTGMREGCRMPNPFDVLAGQGAVAVQAAQRRLFLETAEPGHRPARLLDELATASDPAAVLEQLRRG
jgi:3-hydroxybutyryl-CoA dehydrogenase